MAAEGRKGGDGAALEYLKAKRTAIAEELSSLPARAGGELELAPGGGRESLERIAEFCLRGKMIRGALVYLGAEIAGAAPAGSAGAARVVKLAAAMELFQAGLLVHDDIMDRDETRRGAPTIHARYAAEADSLHVGEALGICLGDLCYFEAYAELNAALAGMDSSARILSLVSSVLAEVAVAQMADVSWGASQAEPSEGEILAMYRSKTARYTFSLPLALGALAAGSGAALAESLIALGEKLGMLFQMRDDELGLFGDQAATGKGLGSDLREGKKTLFRAKLLASAPASELPRLRGLFGGGAEAGPGEIAYIRALAEKLGLGARMAATARAAEEEALAIIRSLPGLGGGTAAVLESLVEYVSRRDR